MKKKLLNIFSHRFNHFFMIIAIIAIIYGLMYYLKNKEGFQSYDVKKKYSRY
jgi:hypothetical protein